MYPEPENVASHRFARLAPKLADKSYRDSYVATQLRIWLADQVRALRGDMTQAEFGKLIGKPQAVVSRLEDPDYGRLTIETLLEVASRLDIALVVRFVDYPTFLLVTNDFSDAALHPAPYDQRAINNLVSYYAAPTMTYAAGFNVSAINQAEGYASGIVSVPNQTGYVTSLPHHGTVAAVSSGTTPPQFPVASGTITVLPAGTSAIPQSDLQPRRVA